MSKKKLLFINQIQFGYHIHSVQYCKYLKEDFDITYICWDYGNKMIEEPDIEIIYISRKDNIIKRNIKFIRYVIDFIKNQNYSYVFIHYFIGSSLIPLLCRKVELLNLDIRSGSISTNYIKRIAFNTIVSFESLFYRSHSIVSAGLRNKLHINKNAFILPLGANPIHVNKHCDHTIQLLYVGSFDNRRMEDTIGGLGMFLNKRPESDIHYTIVGDGWNNERDKLKILTDKLNLQKYIDLIGYTPYNELDQFYEKANVGVSYVPLTDYYEFQPVTKTFEYLMAGMPVIATRTHENKLVINQNNGLLIDDSPESFADAIENLYDKMIFFDEQVIRKSVENYEWSRIVQNMKEGLFI